MKELTFEEFCKLPLDYKMGVQFDWGAIHLYANKQIGLRIEVLTKRKRRGDIYSGWNVEQHAYFFDDDPNLYTTADQAYVAYMEKVCGIKGESK